MRKAAAISFIYLATAAGVVSAKDRSASAQAFMDVYRVLQHPRCMNCHPVADNPMHGDDSHPHAFGVKRGIDGLGLPAARCSKCHQAANQPGEHRPPGAPHPASAKQPAGTARWHLPAANMPLTFQGRTPGQLCRQLLNPKLNGGLGPDALLNHVEHDPLVAWGWQPGLGRTTPPGSHARFVEAVRMWIEGGPACPAEYHRRHQIIPGTRRGHRTPGNGPGARFGV